MRRTGEMTLSMAEQLLQQHHTPPACAGNDRRSN
jgi:hypothetical protein